jgi:hypothetical protein
MFSAKLPYNANQLEMQCLISCSTEYPEYKNGYYLPLSYEKANLQVQ